MLSHTAHTVVTIIIFAVFAAGTAALWLLCDDDPPCVREREKLERARPEGQHGNDDPGMTLAA